jgi:hypothetical protein
MAQSVTLSGPDEDPLLAPLQKFSVLPRIADFVEGVGIEMGWDSDAAYLVEVRTVVRCAFRIFSGS